jgi:hypothetical protein
MAHVCSHFVALLYDAVDFVSPKRRVQSVLSSDLCSTTRATPFRLPSPSNALKSSITPQTPFSHQIVAESPATSLKGRSFGLKLTISHLRSLITTSSTIHHDNRIATLHLNSFPWLIAISSSMMVFETRHRSFHRDSRYLTLPSENCHSQPHRRVRRSSVDPPCYTRVSMTMILERVYTRHSVGT